MATTRKNQSEKNTSAKKNPSTKKNPSAKKAAAKKTTQTAAKKKPVSKKASAEVKPATKKRATGAAAKSRRAAPPEINHETIARRAYFIWEEKGCPQGREDENWLEAEAYLRHRAR